jgi:hypothetical protein
MVGDFDCECNREKRFALMCPSCAGGAQPLESAPLYSTNYESTRALSPQTSSSCENLTNLHLQSCKHSSHQTVCPRPKILQVQLEESRVDQGFEYAIGATKSEFSRAFELALW